MLEPKSCELIAAIATLNPSQKEAACHKCGPAVVFAGAGSGKTRIITHRIALLIENGIRPSQILAVTFTNKAAGEMRERVGKIAAAGQFVHIGTFHSACARWLREFAVHLGFTSDFVIYDEADSRQLIRAIINELNIKKDDVSPNEYQSAINKAKTLGWLPSDFDNKPNEALRIFPKAGLQIYKRYQQLLAKANAMDFNDLLLNTMLLLRRNQDVRSILTSRYKHVLVDEYQDTNPTQFALISMLLSEEKNLFVVGDDDQSIYSWRGANPANILHFTTHYPGAKEIRLEQNYRCSENIVTAANAIIQNNQIRAKKRLYTDNPKGSSIFYQHEHDSETEAWWIIDQIKQERAIYPLEEIAIFYRTNAQSRIFEDTLRRANIPYQIYGALRFYDRAEIKDILAYLRLIINKHDDVALKRVINLPTRGIGDKAIDVLVSRALADDSSMMSALQKITQDSSNKLIGKLKLFFDLYQQLHQEISCCKLSEVINRLISRIEYSTYLKKKYPDEANDKLANIHELAAALADYEDATENASLSSWLNDISLVGSEDESHAGVVLMTLHAAKGLEFKKVFIAGFEDGLIPHINSLDDPDSIEEERRLVYVGITRAKESLTLVSAGKRRVFNAWMANRPSRFLKEIPKEVLKLAFNSEVWQDNFELSIGRFVRHPVYGRGLIKEIDRDFGFQRIVVDFADFGLRKVMGSQLELIVNHY